MALTNIDNLQRFTMADFKPLFAEVKKRGNREGIVDCCGTFGDIKYTMQAQIVDAAVDSITFCWCYEGKNYKQPVNIVYTPSNLGLGYVPYFRCPYTRLKSRKLYTDGRIICSRRAFSHTYTKNSLTPKKREADMYYRLVVAEQQPYRKTHYKGKLTPYGRKLKKLEERLNKSKDIAIAARMERRRNTQGVL